MKKLKKSKAKKLFREGKISLVYFGYSEGVGISLQPKAKK